MLTSSIRDFVSPYNLCLKFVVKRTLNDCENYSVIFEISLTMVYDCIIMIIFSNAKYDVPGQETNIICD